VTALEARQEVREARKELYRLDDKIEAMWDRDAPEPIRPSQPANGLDLPPGYYETVAQERLLGAEERLAEIEDYYAHFLQEHDDLKERVRRVEGTVRKLGGKA
jgi:hypothetical protein